MYTSSMLIDNQPGPPDHQLVGPSESRYAIEFFPPANGTVILATSLAQLQQGGIYLQPGQRSVRLCVEEQGRIIQQSWFVRYSQAGEAIAYIEVLA